MAKPNIPVSFDFFKRYTYHEECVDFMLKLKAKGDQQMYNALLHNKECCERALRTYYEAFYLRPKIRETHPIRIKPVPKKIRDKLLLIPEQSACGSAVNVTLNEENDSNENYKRDAVGNFQVNCANVEAIGTTKNNPKIYEHENRNVLDKQDLSGEGYTVEDDSEPLTSPDVTPTNKENEKECLATKTPKYKDKIATENNMDLENPKISSCVPQDNGITAASSSTNGKQVFNYKALIPYIHCCPLTYNNFRKYSNIVELVREFCEKQNLDAVKQRMVLERSYILFYLAPEYRSITPLDKIQLVDNCPAYIKAKFFTIPTKLYLKEQKNVSKIVDLQKGKPVNQQNISTPFVNNNNESKAQHENTPVVQAADGININTSREKVTENLKQQESCAKATTTSANNNCNDTSSQQKSYQALITTATEMVINLPVSLEEFKKYTYYEEIVEKLFKIKARDNTNLFLKYKSSQEAFNSTLKNFYRSFYLLPAIRKIWPIRFKPMPNFLKSRLLSVPDDVKVTDLNNFKVEQLVSLEFVESSSTKTSPSLEDMEKTKIESQVPIKANSCSIDINSKGDNIEISDAENEQNSPMRGIKRSSNDASDSSPPKRPKAEETKDYSNNTENKKKSYKDMLPYAHCCPITFSEFCKYTNISELFTGYCKKRYNSVKKLPYMLQRAYILYYLAPENRQFKPFNKLKILNNCPLNLKDKVFEIPANLYIKDEKSDLENQEKTQTETEVVTEDQRNKTAHSHPKEPIEILENRLLTPTTIMLSDQFNKERNYCCNSSCVFHHISSFDFLKLTNILNILPKPHDATVIQDAFKKFICKLVKEQTCDEKFVINSALLCKLLKYNHICANCENNAQTLNNLDGTGTSSVSENDRLSNVTSATVVERCVADKLSSIEKQTESLPSDVLTQQLPTEQQPVNIVEHLRRDKIFSKFSQRLLLKLNQSYDGTVDFSSDCYKIFLECNEVPLKKILNDFCENNEAIVQRILNQTELYEAFQRYYYFKYITKYPEKVKQKDPEKNYNKTQLNNAKASDEKHKTVTKPLVTGDVTENSSNNEQNSHTEAANVREEDNNSNVTLIQEKSLNSNNDFERAKRIFFRYVDKTHTLSYVLRTSFGYKQAILRTVLTLSYKEFLEMTSVYDGNELYNDNHIAECMYRYVFRTPLVWPTNLYITLENLCKFLREKHILFENYSTMLVYISPKLLHWSILLSCTNILDCVQSGYNKRTGKTLNVYDIKTLKQECIEYYNRCWKHDKWLGGTPRIYEEYYKEHLMQETPGDVSTTDGSSAKQDCEIRTANAVDAVNESLACVQQTAETDTSTTIDGVSKECNFVSLPDTQQQIEMLPPEQTVSKDPLGNSSYTLNLNVSSTSADSCEVLGELTTQAVKSEPAEINLLSNILFYEDDDSNFQWVDYEEEIVCLDNTVEAQVIEENLPPSQMDFEDSLEQRLYTVLMNSEDTNFLLNMPRYLPSSSESHHDNACTQAFMQPSPSGELISNQLEHLPDECLRSSGEKQDIGGTPNQNLTEITHESNICLEHDRGENIMEYIPGSSLEHQENHCFPDALEAMQMFSENVGATQAELVSKESAETSAVTKAAMSVESTTLKTIQPFENSKNINQPNVCQTRLPTLHGTIRTYSSTKRSKSIATVKPLTKSGLVPQIQHNTRPLQTVTAYATSSSKQNQGQPPVSETSPPSSLVLSLTPTNNSSNSSVQNVQNSSFQLQLSNLDGQIFISQELNKNCSVFDNSSLLRIVDHNYHKQLSQTSNQEATNNSSIREEVQDGVRTTHNISICRDGNVLPSSSSRRQNDSEQSNSNSNVRSVTISSTTSSLYGTNNKEFVVRKK